MAKTKKRNIKNRRARIIKGAAKEISKIKTEHVISVLAASLTLIALVFVYAMIVLYFSISGNRGENGLKNNSNCAVGQR